MKKKISLDFITKILTVVMCIALLFGCVNTARVGNSARKAQNKENTTASTTAKKGTTTANLICAGDNLIHKAIFEQAKQRSEDGGYDFSYAYENVADYIKNADLAFLNQETVIAPSKDVSSFPLFNSPPELLDEMIDIGFDVFNQSTNHVMDKGLSGALEDYDLFTQKKDILLTGLYKTWDDMFTPQTVKRNDITFSFVGFTEYLNGLTVPSDSDLGLLYLTDTRHEKQDLYDTMQKMINAAKQASDIVCVSMHWQDEDITLPDESQREIAQKLVDMGADIIIGTGPHVLQPIEYLTREDGSKVLVIWSLGNFISTQSNRPNLLGGLADITVSKNYDTGKAVVSDCKFIPTVTHYGSGRTNVRIIPFESYTQELASNHGANITYSYIDGFYKEMFGDMLVLNKKEPETTSLSSTSSEKGEN